MVYLLLRKSELLLDKQILKKRYNVSVLPSSVSIQQPNTLYLTVPEMSERSYSTATVAPSGARLVFISGLNAYGKKPVPKDVKAQLEIIFAQLNEALDIAGSKPECILMIKQYSTDFSDDFFETF